MTNAIKVLLQMQSGFLQLESTITLIGYLIGSQVQIKKIYKELEEPKNKQ
jgi:hypothetical protein